MSVDQALSKAKSYLKKDEFAEAQKLYQAVLLNFPQNIRAQQGLALLNNHNKKIDMITSPPQEEIDHLIDLHNTGQLSNVVKKAQVLSEQYPNDFIIWNILGISSIQIGLLHKAIAAYKKCLFINPNYADAYKYTGIALKNMGKLEEALDSFKKFTSLKPNNTQAYFEIGNTLKDLGKVNEAIEAYKKCISLKPDYAEAYNNMGIALRIIGKFDKAIEAYKRAISLKPNYAEAYCNKGNALQDECNLENAIKAYKKSLSLKPNCPVTYKNMGNTLLKQGKINEAIKVCNKCISLKPDYAEAYINKGNALKEQDKIDEAITAYSKALSIKPDYEIARAQKLFLQAYICDWNINQEDSELVPSLGTSDKFVPPFSMLSFEDSPERHRLRSEVFVRAQYPHSPLPLKQVPSNMPDRIRIGYFSADFHHHATMCLMLKVFAVHDRQKFEIYVYSYGPEKKDKMRQKLIKSVDVFDDVREMSDKDIALLARQDQIDIAVDLKGLTKDQRLGIFAYRPAPIQISYLGYPGTTGTNFIDYIVADPIVIPTNQMSAYTEKIIYLPHSYQPNDNTRAISLKTGTRKDMGLPERGFVFCCFNNNYKISCEEFDIWMRLLSRIENSVLWLLKSNQWAEQNLKKEAEKRGIQKDRLIFADILPHDEHLARHKHADLFVDTFNVNAHTTASDALWAGLPVVTRLGQGFVARVAGSLLNAVGLPELITESEKEYESLILELAMNPHKLKKMKDKLAINRLTQPLFDTETYTKYLEIGYQKAYQNYFEGNNPQTLIASQ